VHGRNAEVRKDLFLFLRKIGLEPIEWSEAVKATGKGAPFIGDILDKAFERAQAVVVLLTPDDQARLRSPYRKANDPAYEKRLTGQARPNVLFEAGMAFGRHPDHTILVQVGETREFSDIAGRHVVRLSQSAESRQELASRLETAGCQPNLDGSEWLSAGTFRIKA
jgi:predicted nucleotide-binding protein